MQDIITYSGWLMTAVSLTAAYFQSKNTKKISERTKRISERRKQGLIGIIKQLSSVTVELDLIEKSTKKFSDAIILRHLTSAHQAGRDLYQNLVTYYLSLEDSFTYTNLRNIRQMPIISSEWQDECWRSVICMREENKNVDIPDEHYINDSKSSRTQNKERGEPKQVEDKTT